MVGAAQAAELFGTVDAVTGAASLTGENGASTSITVGTKVFVSQSVATGADGEVHIVTADSGLIALRPNSNFRVDRYQARGEDTDEIAFSLIKGALRSITGWIAKRNPAAYSLSTMTTTIGVRGTDHETIIIETQNGTALPGTYDTVYEGATVMKNALGSAEVHTGECAYTARDAVPALLAHRPEFLERRTLRIEQRIQQRKETLRADVRSRMQARDNKPDITERRERARRLHDRHRQQ
jgi:hypothetical protein